MSKAKEIKTKEEFELKDGEVVYIATVKLRLNRGHLVVEGGDKVIMGPADEAAGINLSNLIANGGIVPFVSEEQAQEIRDHYNEVTKPARDGLRQDILMDKRRKHGQSSS